MNYRALAIDLDGTLLVGENLPDANRIAVAEAADKGFQIIIATARWRQMAERISQEIGIRTPIIACSGAQVYLHDQSADIFDERLPSAAAEQLFELCNQYRCIATVTGTDQTLLKLDGRPDLSQLPSEMRWVPELQLNSHDLPRIVTVQGTELVQHIKQALAPVFRNQLNISDSIGPSGKLVLTLTAASANKGTALLETCRHLNLAPEHVIAFGDAENDIEMFRVTGASVAMGNADRMIQAAATVTTLANTEAGVAYTINRLLETGELG